MKFRSLLLLALLGLALSHGTKKQTNLRSAIQQKIQQIPGISRYYTDNCYQQTNKKSCLGSMSLNGDYGLVNKCAYCDNLYCIPVDPQTEVDASCEIAFNKIDSAKQTLDRVSKPLQKGLTQSKPTAVNVDSNENGKVHKLTLNLQPGIVGEYFNYAHQKILDVPPIQKLSADYVKRQEEINMNHLVDTHPFSENFAARFTGYFRAKTQGSYQLCLVADDGAHLYFDTENLSPNWPRAGMKPLINNGGTHSARMECSPNMNLNEGVYPFYIEYFQAHWDYRLELKYSGPQTNGQLQLVSPDLLSAPPTDAVARMRSKLNVEIVNAPEHTRTVSFGQVRSLPSSQSIPITSLDLTQPLSSVSAANFYARVNFHLKVNEAAEYTVCVNGDGESHLYTYVRNLFVDHNAGGKQSCNTMYFWAGEHSMTLVYHHQGSGAKNVAVTYKQNPTEQEKQSHTCNGCAPIPASVLVHAVKPGVPLFRFSSKQ